MDADGRRTKAPLNRLKDLGARFDSEAMRRFLAGVAAAPEGADPNGWMTLVAPRNASTAVKATLARVLNAARAKASGGLDRRGTDPERLRALRRRLKADGLDGFIVPRSDEHQGEYVAKRAERLAWLTGFTGSAGWAAVLARRAAIFVDGRYTLQVRGETDVKSFAPFNVAETSPWAWLARELSHGARMGYDPWLITPDQVSHLKAACDKAGATLVAVAENPLDAVWTDQPAPPISPVVPHPDRFAGCTAADKRRIVADILKKESADAAVLTAPDSIAWLLNVRGGDVPFTPLALGFAVLHADGSVNLFMDKRKASPGLNKHLGKTVRLHDPDAFGPALDKLGRTKARVRVDPQTAAAWVFQRLEAAGARIRRADDPCQAIKAVKTRAQLDGIRAAHRRDGLALSRFLAWLSGEAPKGRVTEIAAADALEAFRRKGEHFRGLSFPTISGAGANGAIVHYRVTPATDRKLKPGTLYLVDSGAQYLDGTTDVTRTVAVGTPTPEMKDRFTRVLKGHIAIATATFPEGTTGPQLDALARTPLWEAGLDYDHGTGHGVGHYLGVHEGPHRIGKAANRHALVPGMIVSNEPGYYRTGAYGIRIENLVAVVRLKPGRKDERPMLGFETLTLAPIDRALIETRMLTDAEIAWVDAYHRTVMKTHGPRLDAAARRWLRTATAPLRARRRARLKLAPAKARKG